MIKLLVLAIISVITYYYAPKQYSYNYCIFCLTIFSLSSISMLINNCKQTLVKFEFFFVVCMFFACIAYPIIHYPINPYFSLFNLPFNENYICKGLGLSVIGMCFFNLFVYEKEPIELYYGNYIFDRLYFPKLIFYILIICFIPYLYLLLGKGIYTTEFEHSLINCVLVYFIYYGIYSQFINLNTYDTVNKNLSYFINPQNILILVYMVLFMMIGSRTIPLRIIMTTLFVTNLLYWQIKRSVLLLFIIIGSLLMTFIGVVRMGETFEMASLTSGFELGNDLTINNRSLYVLMEYVDLHGISWGKSFLMHILAAFPFAQSIFLSVTGIDPSEINSALLVTYSHFNRGDENLFGLGTNLIGDIYLGFGTPGVIILMSLLGYFVKTLYARISNGNILSILFYMILFMDVIYLPRSSYFVSVRPLVWCYVIYYFCNKQKTI